MPIRTDVDAGIVVVAALIPAVEDNDDTNVSTTIDLHDYPGYRVMLIAGTGARTDGTFTFSVEQSSDDSTYAALTASSGSVAAVSAANTVREAGYQPTKRYLQVKSVASATTSGALQYAFVLLVPPFGSI
jgi:hypothetical protein